MRKLIFRNDKYKRKITKEAKYRILAMMFLKKQIRHTITTSGLIFRTNLGEKRRSIQKILTKRAKCYVHTSEIS